MNEKIIWSNVLELITNEVTSLSFETWFKDTELLNIEDTTLVVSVKNEFTKEILNTRYIELIRNSALQVLNKEYAIKFVLPNEQTNLQNTYNEILEEERKKMKIEALKRKAAEENGDIG